MTEIEFIGFDNVIITVNGRVAALKKAENGGSTLILNDGSERYDVEIVKAHRYMGKGYILWNLLFFFVSIFGIFDVREGKRFPVCYCRFNVSCETDCKITVCRQAFEDGGKYAEIRSDVAVEEDVNVQYYDKDAKRKHRRMKKIRFFAAAVAVILAAVIITLT